MSRDEAIEYLLDVYNELLEADLDQEVKTQLEGLLQAQMEAVVSTIN